jgi:hypothetical protein
MLNALSRTAIEEDLGGGRREQSTKEIAPSRTKSELSEYFQKE